MEKVLILKVMKVLMAQLIAAVAVAVRKQMESLLVKPSMKMAFQ